MIQTGPDVHLTTEATISALAAANDPVWPITMRRGRSLVRLDEDGDQRTLLEHTTTSLQRRMSEVAAYVNGAASRVQPPPGVARAVLDSATQEVAALPPCDGVATAAYVGPGFETVTEPGYNPRSRLLLRPTVEVPPVILDGERTGPAAAAWLIDNLLADFPLETSADVANALAAVVTLSVRPAIQGATPMFAYLAPTGGAGTGKGLLSRVSCIGALGGPPIMQAPLSSREGEEWRKAISTLLMRAPRAVCFDNITDLDSTALAMAITSEVWHDRRMRTMSAIDVPITNVWLATSNGLHLSQEMARRIVPIYLDAGVDDPQYRSGPTTGPRAGGDWLHLDLATWVAANRGRVLRAVLTMVEWWKLENMARAEMFGTDEAAWNGGAPLGSEFGAFTRSVGGILLACNVHGFLDNHRRLWDQAVGEDHADAFRWFAALHALPGNMDGHTTEQLLDGALLGGGEGGLPGDLALSDALPVIVIEAGNREAKLKALRYWMRDHRDGTIRGYRLVGMDAGRATKWVVQWVAA